MMDTSYGYQHSAVSSIQNKKLNNSENKIRTMNPVLVMSKTKNSLKKDQTKKKNWNIRIKSDK